MFRITSYSEESCRCTWEMALPSISSVAHCETFGSNPVELRSIVRSEFAAWLVYSALDLAQMAINITSEHEIPSTGAQAALIRCENAVKWWNETHDYKTLLKSWSSLMISLSYTCPPAEYGFTEKFSATIKTLNEVVKAFSNEFFNHTPFPVTLSEEKSAA